MTKAVEILIIEQLNRMEQNLDAVRTVDIPSIRERLKGVEVKSAVTGALTGGIGGTLAALTAILMKFMH